MQNYYMKECLLAAFMLVSSVSAATKVEKEEVTIKTTEKTINNGKPPYYHRLNFSLSRVGYEYIKPESLYVGGEAWMMLCYGSFPFERTMAEAEVRTGYNFLLNEEDRFTPVIGLGYFQNRGLGGCRDSKHHEDKQGLWYITLGALYEHQFNNVFDLGVNLKGLLGHCTGKKRWGDPVWGFDLSLPLTFHFGERRNWDIRLEPFYIQMFGPRKTHDFAGGRSSFGYRF